MAPAFGVRGLLSWLEGKKREAEAFGTKIDLVVLPFAVEDMLFKAALKESLATNEYSMGERYVYLLEIPVMFSKDRLPWGQCWLRYSGGKKT